MEDQMEHPSEEDIPSDFFDDFNKDEFIQGLSVIDSWDDEDGTLRKPRVSQPRARIYAEAVDSVKDLRELIDGKDTPIESKKEESQTESSHSRRSKDRNRSNSESRLNAYIQPGSRRDPNKTTEAIKRDKEVKVKEHLAKHLESSDDLRPPGTELDDFFVARKSAEMKNNAKLEESPPKVKWEYASPTRRSPRRKQQFEQRSPRRSPRRSPMRRSPVRRSPMRRSPIRRSPHRRSPHRRSPHRRSPHRRSPFRRSPEWHFPQRYNKFRFSPQRKFNKYHRSSPIRPNRDRHYTSRISRSRSRSIGRKSDDFLYPKEFSVPKYDPKYDPRYKTENVNNPYPSHPYTEPGATEYPAGLTGYSFTQNQVYPSYPMSYDYATQPASIPVPQPVPAPSTSLNLAPPMVPAPQPIMALPAQTTSQQLQIAKAPVDPLAQLVAEGKLSHEDYLKLAPNKGSSNSGDSVGKIIVLRRCSEAISELEKLALPTRLLINNSVIGKDQKRLAPKFCSPLKRQVAVEFHYTKADATAAAQQNKQIVNNIIAAIGLEKVVDRTKKKVQKNTKDAAVQTMKPFCDMCEIRNATKCFSLATFTEPEYFSSSVHTQVVEHDLISSKSVFNPTGSGGNNPTMSIAHLTPAQLVSQLAARAKTLKQSPDPTQYGRHNSPGYDGSWDQNRHYHENYSNYRY